MIDIERLITFRNYAKRNGFSRQWIYVLAREGKIKTVDIDSVKFVQL